MANYFSSRYVIYPPDPPTHAARGRQEMSRSCRLSSLEEDTRLAAAISRLQLSWRERLADSCHDGIVVGKEDPAFLRDLLIPHPDGEFTAAAFD